MAAVTLPTGKRHTLYGKTQQEVARKLTGALRNRDAGLPVPPERQTVAHFLTKWLETAEPTVRRTTFIRYREYIRLHAIPVIGRIRLPRLSPQHLQDLYSKKLSDGLSPTSVRHLHSVLHRALKHALRWNLVARNVCEAVTPPRRATSGHRTLTLDEVRVFLEAARQDRLEALYVLAVTTGMRRGELLGLHWQDVNLEQGRLQVRYTLQQGGFLGEPKTARASRQIDLPSLSVEALKRHRLHQLKERIEAGPLWTDTGFVFTNALGNYVDPDNLRHRSFGPLLRRAGVSKIRFHDLRHTAATLLLSLDTRPKVVQEPLGHSQISVTMDVYSHALPTMQREAMNDLDRLIRA